MEYGLQLFSVRDTMETDMEDTLRQVAEMGYAMIEPAGFFGHPAEEVAGYLKKYGLKMCSTHTTYKNLTGEKATLAETVAYHKTVGCNTLILPSIPASTKEEVEAAIANINRWQPQLEAEGIQMLYHNHHREFLPNKDGQIFEEILVDRTNIGLEIDTFWAFDSGNDPLAILDKYKGRVKMIHLKDGFRRDLSNPESKATGKSLGMGEAPVAAVRKKAIAMGLPMVVESEGLDPVGIEEVRRCINFLKEQDAKD